MAKKIQNKHYLVLLVIIVVVIVILYKQYTPAVEEEAAEPEVEEEEVVEAPAAEPADEEAQPLYPDLCYAEGGTPREECRSGETSIGDVPGFKTPHVCCVSE